jgi:signal transduction histidine kinase/ligand-binding sensor domain-containing protein
MKPLFLTFFLVCFCSPIVYGQQYQFKKYKVEEGLVNNETFEILQDQRNRIWVSTTGGVSCFDGKNFTNYTVEDGLPSNICFSIFEDSKGRIWVGTMGKGISIIENGKVTTPKGLDFNALASATSFLEDEDGTIYIFFINGIGVYKDGKLSYLFDSSEMGTLHFQQAAWYDSNTIYIASLKKGIFKLTLDPFKLENIYDQNDGINNICYSVVVDTKKNVWVGAYGELNKITNGKLTIYKFNPEDFNNNRIYGIRQENDDELFLSFEGNGFGIFNKKTGNLEVINEAQGLPTKYIYRTIKDTEGNYWMTSYGEGIIRFRDNAFKIYDDKHGLPSKSVYAVEQWGDEAVVATDKGIVAFTDTKKIKSLVKDVSVKNIFVTPNNNLLYTTNEAVWELSKDGTQKLIDKGDYSLLFADEENTFLFLTDKIKAITKDSTYTIKSSRSIAIEPINDRYVLCKISGLFQLRNNKVDTIPGLHPLEHNNFRSIDAISENELIAGSEKNLYYLKFENDQFQIKIFEMSRFETLKRFRSLKVDGNNLWMTGKNLLMKVDLSELLENNTIITKIFNTVPNFLENEVDYNSLIVTKDKTVLATSLDGVLAFNENTFKPNTLPPKLELSNILLFAEPLQDSLYTTKKGIVLPYQKNYLSFSMEAITFTNPEEVKYKYRMTGLRDSDEWSQPTKDSKVVFSFLPPGDYTFEFTADNGDGAWQPQPFEYSFMIKVPFWRTWYFWVSLFSFTSISIFLFYYFKNKAEQRRNETYTHNLIKAQEEERTRVARELHDSVGQKLMLLTKKTKSAGSHEMEALASNTLEELRAISRGLHPATLERLGPTAAIRNMIDEVDTNTNIFFTHEIEDIDTFLSKEASLHLYRIIQEVLNNMVKHAEAKAASVIIEKKKNTIEATISDNGKGFEYSEKVKTSESLGMKTLLERAKILHSKIDIKSQINKGTTVTLTIPI